MCRLIFVMHLIPLVKSLLALIFLSAQCGLLLLFLLMSRVLQNRALNVYFVHEIKGIARSLKLVVETGCILLSHKLFQLAHTRFLRSLGRAAKKPGLLLEDREVFDPEVALLLVLQACCRGL